MIYFKEDSIMRPNTKKQWRWIWLLVLVITGFVLLNTAISQERKTPFYPKGTYLDGIPTPDEVIGFPLGEKPVRHAQVIQYFKALAEKSPRVRLMVTGETFEGRKLVVLLVSSEENIARLDQIQADLARLSDPRKMKSRGEAQTLIENTPAVAWMMYTVHGNELSGTDASLQLAYQLAAGTDEVSRAICRDLVVGIDPLQNPDGRERCLQQIDQWKGQVPTSDVQSIRFSGVWPSGRSNHYLFDMNRDWFICSQPETQARVKAILEWNPQLVVDAHEMGSFSSYFFNPPREPVNPYITSEIKGWWKVFARDQAESFDQYGWSYSTNEMFDEWYPGYGSSWPYFLGAVSILYEQARTAGAEVKRPDGTRLSFREAVHHQFISSLSNLKTAAENRKGLLTDFYQFRSKSVSKPAKGKVSAYLVDPGKNPSRAKSLADRLTMQGLEVEQAEAEFRMRNIQGYWDAKPVTKSFPKGTLIIRMDQPLSLLVTAIMEFDLRMSTKLLQEERKSLEKGKGTKMYEVGAWSMPMAFGLEAYTSTVMPSVRTEPFQNTAGPQGEVINPKPAYGYLIDYQDDGVIDALYQCFKAGYKVCAARKPFRIGGKSYSRGALLLRNQENPLSLEQGLSRIAEQTKVRIIGVNTALSEKGPDLGGIGFQLLTEPRIALLTGPSLSSSNFGALWYMLDVELKCRHSILDASSLARTDLRKYNVLILPSAWGGTGAYQTALGKQGLKKLKDWVSDGGTLIGIENAAAFLADTTSKFSKARLKRQALKDLKSYEEDYEWEKKAGRSRIDSLAIWEGKTTPQPESAKPSKGKEDFKNLKKLDERQRLFKPWGSMVRVDVNQEHWLAFGLGQQIPALVNSSYALLSKRPVQTAARLSEASHLRLSGLMWPEARSRWEKTCYAVRESMGSGQIILFASDPNFRSYYYGTARMLINGIFLGPGFGTRSVVEL
jgi:hypothetical protein